MYQSFLYDDTIEHQDSMEKNNYNFSTILSCTVTFNSSKMQQERQSFVKYVMWIHT